MQDRDESVRARLVCIPSADRAFAETVARHAAATPAMTTRELADKLRPLYPDVAVHVRGLSGEPIATWYVYRDMLFGSGR